MPQNKQDINRNGSFKIDDNVYVYPQDKLVILNEILYAPKVFSKYIKNEGSIYYKNVCASFDTETTSMYYNGDKTAVMYIWMFSVNGKVIIGRTWQQFETFMEEIGQLTSNNERLIVYVHNLGFDFSFFCHRLTWHKTFCAKIHEPIYAITTTGIEFRDSYILTSKSLEKSAKDLNKYKIEKQTGSLDYKLIRGSNTKLTDKELKYCIYDCLVLDAIIQEKIEQDGSIAKIPLTNTGYVRRFLKEKCYPGSHKKKNKQAEWYRTLMCDLTMTPEEYQINKRAFQGGFTHANALYVNHTFTQRVDSIDFTSSYPAVMMSEMFPMSRPTHYVNVTLEKFKELYKDKLIIFDVRFNNIRKKTDVFDCPLSVSKCNGSRFVENNGRLVSADYAVTTITNIDMSVIKNFYDYDTIQVGEILAYDKDYLPKPIIEGLIDLYKDKTELKDVKGYETEYQVKKGMFNSVYGCSVTDPVKDVITFDTEWHEEKTDLHEAIEHYNNSKNRFLYYPWGVFVTSYARRNLFMGILEFGIDYIYSDTDSIKCINYDKHIKFIEWYNEIITDKINLCLDHYGFNHDCVCPKTIKGVSKPLGVWDHETKEESYTAFKTLGAKRYIYTQGGTLHITIAGLNKKQGCDYLRSFNAPVLGLDEYDFFTDDFYVPKEATGKLTHTYLKEERKTGTFTDYQGLPNVFDEIGGVHLENADFTLSLTGQFKQYLQGVQQCCMI